MAKVLSLFGYEADSEQEHLPFVVFDAGESAALFSASPDLMQLSENIFVADLGATSSYWRFEASKGERSATQLIGEHLRRKLDGHGTSVFCAHPFQGLVLQLYLMDRGAPGTFETSSMFSEKTYRNLSWRYWVQAAEALNMSFDKAAVFVRERKQFKTHLGKFERFLKRLRIEKAGDLSDANFREIERRFDLFIGQLWRWTFPEATVAEDRSPDLFNYRNYDRLGGFPWIPYLHEEPILVKRSLEFSLSTWEQISNELAEDLLKISAAKVLEAPTYIVGLSWKIVLFDLAEVHLEISFRYPMSIVMDRDANFKIILAQLRGGFDKFQHELKEKVEDTDLSNVPLVIGWELSVSRTVMLPGQAGNLLLAERAAAASTDEIAALGNQFTEDLSRYSIEAVHIPSLDFSTASLSRVGVDSGVDEAFSQFSMQPLFIYPEPVAANESEIKTKRFIERTSSAWWVTGDLQDSFRDYYMCEKISGELVWAYRNHREQWFIHGLYA